MKFICKTSELQKGIAIVEKAVPVRSTMPVLENLYLDLKGTVLTLRGNDLEIGIEYQINVDSGSEDGQLLLKAKTLSGILSKLNQPTIEFSTNASNKATLKSGKVDFELLGIAPEDYPTFPSITSQTELKLNVQDLKDLIKHTIFSVSLDETKQFLNGILVKNEQDQLLLISTDGYRLSLKRQSIIPLNEQLSIITPFKAMNELNRILQLGEPKSEISLFMSDKQVAFKMDKFLMVSRVIEGQFPDYNQVIPEKTGHQFVLSRRLLLEACERANIIASAYNQVIRLFFDDTKLVIKASAPGMGDFQEDLALERKLGSGSAKIAFNVKLLLDAIKIVSADDVLLTFQTELSPCRLDPVSDESYTYIIMPIRSTDFQQDEEAQPSAAESEPVTSPEPTPKPVVESTAQAPGAPQAEVEEQPSPAPEAPISEVSVAPTSTAPETVAQPVSSESSAPAIPPAPVAPVAPTAPEAPVDTVPVDAPVLDSKPVISGNPSVVQTQSEEEVISPF